MPPTDAHIDALPDDLLGYVFVLADEFSIASTATLVCKRWHHVFWNEPWIWQNVFYKLWDADGDPAAQRRQYDCLLFMLRRVTPLVQEFELDGRSAQYLCSADSVPGGSLAEVLGLLHPAQLTSLVLRAQRLSPGAVAALPRLSRLQHLTVIEDVPIPLAALQPVALPTALATALAQLTQLGELRLIADELPASVVAVAGSLTRLSTLVLTSRGGPLADSLSPLSALSALQVLLLCGGRTEGGSPQLPSLACFPALEVIGMCMPVVQFCGAPPLPASPPTGIADFGIDRRSGCFFDGADLSGLGAGRLQALLDAAAPPAAPAMAELHLRHCTLSGDCLRGCSQLAAITSLQLEACNLGQPAAATADALAAALQQVPQLRHLSVSDSPLEGLLPTALAAVPAQLEQLMLPSCGLSDLPAGPYLAGITALDLFSNDLEHLPPAIAGANRLCKLSLVDNPGFALDEEAVDTLAALPCLAELALGDVGPARLVAALARRRPDLEFV